MVELHAIGKVHDYYMMPFLPIMFIAVGLGIQRMEVSFPKHQIVLAICLLIAPFYAVHACHKKWSIEKSHFNKDLIYHRDALQCVVPNESLCIILEDPSTHIFSYQIDKLGFVFDRSDFPVAWMPDMIHQGAKYLYSDSRAFDERNDIQPFLEDLLLEAGTLRVYRLNSCTE